MTKTTVSVLKWVIYTALLLGFFVVQTTVGLIAVFDIRPVLIVAFAVAVSMQEREWYALSFGVIAGFMWDFSSGKASGFNAFVLAACCVVIALAVMYLIGNNFLNSMIFCGATMLLQGILDYLFSYQIWGYEGSWFILVRYILPTALYTVLITPLMYFLVRRLHRKLEGMIRA